LLAKYLDQFPEVDVKVRTETSPLLTDLVLKRRIEGALACNPIKHPDLISEVILDEELVVLTAPHIRKLGEISPDTRLIVLGQGSLYQDQLRAILIRQGIEVTRVMELGTLEVIVGCVACGLGVTLLPRAVLDLVSPKGSVRAHSVMDEDCRVQTLFVRRRNAFVSSALSAFLDCARAYSSRHNPGTRANLVMSAKAAF
jgi:DNA-binding transcriptional LysR family regulator